MWRDKTLYTQSPIEFEALYESLETNGLIHKTVIFTVILD